MGCIEMPSVPESRPSYFPLQWATEVNGAFSPQGTCEKWCRQGTLEAKRGVARRLQEGLNCMKRIVSKPFKAF